MRQNSGSDFCVPTLSTSGWKGSTYSSLTAAALLRPPWDKQVAPLHLGPAPPTTSSNVPLPLWFCSYSKHPCEGADVTTSILEVDAEAQNGSNLPKECGREKKP